MMPALPHPIAAYVEANAQLDVDGMLPLLPPMRSSRTTENVTRATLSYGPCLKTR